MGRSSQASGLQAAMVRVRVLDLKDGLQVKGKTVRRGGTSEQTSPALPFGGGLEKAVHDLADKETRCRHLVWADAPRGIRSRAWDCEGALSCPGLLPLAPSLQTSHPNCTNPRNQLGSYWTYYQLAVLNLRGVSV